MKKAKENELERTEQQNESKVEQAERLAAALEGHIEGQILKEKTEELLGKRILIAKIRGSNEQLHIALKSA